MKAGDQVVIGITDMKLIRHMQQTRGGWDDAMKECLVEPCVIIQVNGTDAIVQTPSGNKFLLNSKLLIKYNPGGETFSTYVEGDLVRMIDDMQKVKMLQKGHGGWKKSMNLMLGRRGIVKCILRSGDLLVKSHGREVRLNPNCVIKASRGSEYSRAGSLKSRNSTLDPDESDEDSDEYMVPESALEQAVLTGDYATCCKLIENGADVNALNSEVMTPIMYAAQNGNQDILRRLIQHSDANLSIRDKDGDTALHLAVQNSRVDSVETLLEAGVDMRAVNNYQLSAFHMAAMGGHKRILELFLLQKDVSIVDLQKDDNVAAIHLVAYNNRPDCLRLLIQHQADVNIRTIKLQSALHLAVSKKNMECVQILVENKADLNLTDESGDTPLHDAILVHQTDRLKFVEGSKGTKKAEEIVLYLVQNGASLHIINHIGKSPLDMCQDSDLKAKLQKVMTVQDHSVPHNDQVTNTYLTPPHCAQVEDTSSENQDFEELKKRIEELEEEKKCTICYDKKLNVTFGCGHMTCTDCADNLFKCPMCCIKIDKKIKTFL